MHNFEADKNPLLKITHGLLKDCVRSLSSCKEKVEIPKEAEDLILKLLEKNLKYRILSNEIAYHNWFKDINFRDILLQNLKCPYIGIYFSRK